ncbi:MAG: sulfotransferase [Salinibacter sp.]
MAHVDRPLLIVGCPRSGTGILHQLVRLHPAVAWITPFSNWVCGKSWFRRVPPALAHGVETVLHHTPNALLPPLFRGPHDGSLGLPSTFETHEGHSIWHRALPDADNHRATERAAPPGVRAYLRTVVDWHRRYHGRPRFVWKTPRNAFRLRFLHALFPEAYVVHLVRDGRAVAASILKRRRHDLGDRHKWWGARPPGWREIRSLPPVQQAAWMWTESLKHIRTDAPVFPTDHVLELQYETLTSEPESELRRLFAFAGLDPAAFFTAENRRQMRQLHPPRHTWRSRLSDEQKTLLEDTLREDLRRYGYIENGSAVDRPDTP